MWVSDEHTYLIESTAETNTAVLLPTRTLNQQAPHKRDAAREWRRKLSRYHQFQLPLVRIRFFALADEVADAGDDGGHENHILIVNNLLAFAHPHQHVPDGRARHRFTMIHFNHIGKHIGVVYRRLQCLSMRVTAGQHGEITKRPSM